MAELAGFGIELNPAIDAATDRLEPPVIARLRLGLKPGERALGIGEELPPNVLMRYGLSDPRNYDSVELARSLRWFETLYEPGEAAQTSRRQISWEGVLRARQRLREASVAAVVGCSAASRRPVRSRRAGGKRLDRLARDAGMGQLAVGNHPARGQPRPEFHLA